MWNRQQPAREQVNDHVVTALQQFDMSQEWTQCKRASVWLCLNICSFLRTALCVCGQLTVGKKKKYTGTDTHVVADISAPKEVEETQNEWLHKEEIRLG